jgi:protein-ribulosamine 3-kinase
MILSRYHYLNHHAIFGGGGYRTSAVSIMQQLLRKYYHGTV